MYNKIKYYFKIVLYYLLLLLSSALFVPFFVLRPKNVVNGYVYATALRNMLRIYGLEFRIRNSEILKEKSGAVIISNHQSVLDIIAMSHVWGYVDKMCVVTKKELIYMGTFGLITYLIGSVFIDRKNAKSAYKSLEVTIDILTKQRTKVWVYPEGTRNVEQKTKLLPFKKGAFNMAVAAQVPIIPVVSSHYYFIDRKKRIFNTGHIIIQCLEPVPTVGLTVKDVPELCERLHGMMLKTYENLSDEAMSNLSKKN